MLRAVPPLSAKTRESNGCRATEAATSPLAGDQIDPASRAVLLEVFQNEPVHEGPLWRRDPQGPAPTGNLGRPGNTVFPARQQLLSPRPCGRRVREELDRGSPQRDGRTSPGRADGACPPDGVPLPEEIKGGVISKDRICPDGRIQRSKPWRLMEVTCLYDWAGHNFSHGSEDSGKWFLGRE